MAVAPPRGAGDAVIGLRKAPGLQSRGRSNNLIEVRRRKKMEEHVMHGNTSYRQPIVVVVIAVLALTAAPRTGFGQSFIISPDQAEPQTGMSYGEWSAVWWQYALSKSVNDPNNPLLSQTGERCTVDQPGSSPVFFLVGASSSGVVTRDECTVPAGKVLFFPLVNFIDIHVPGDGLDTPELLRQDLLSFIGPVTDLHASVDGVAVNSLNARNTPFRACAGGDPACASAFSVTLPGNNLFGIRAGVYAPAVADGYYLMVGPLPPGPHTINFGGKGIFAKSRFVQEITYNLFVERQ
jgi:hypothetical protein